VTGQVEVMNEHRVAGGTDNDVYIGMWLGREKVALRRPRLLLGSRGVQKVCPTIRSIFLSFKLPRSGSRKI
jgi:hypothetical protein